MRGQAVEVGTATEVGADAFGHPVFELEWREVGNVLVDPMPSATGSDRTDMHDPRTENTFTLHFPKGLGLNLEHGRVRALGYELEVLGNPVPYPEELAPTDWNLTVRARRVDSA